MKSDFKHQPRLTPGLPNKVIPESGDSLLKF